MGGLSSLVNKATDILFDTEASAAAATGAGAVQAEAFREGTAEVGRQFDVTQETLRPSIEAGDVAREQQLALLGLRGKAAQQASTQAIQESPSQAFLRKRAQRNLLQNAAAIGGIGGGNIRTALVEQGAGFASQDLERQFQRLQGLSAPGTQTAVQQGAFGTQTAGQIAQLTGQAGAATASGILGAQQAKAQARGQIIGAGTTAGTLKLLSDENMKYDIEDLDLEECYEIVMTMNLKAWRYLESTGLDSSLHFGCLAQEAPEVIRAGKINGMEMLDLHDELNLIAGALQYMKDNDMMTVH